LTDKQAFEQLTILMIISHPKHVDVKNVKRKEQIG